MTAAAGTQFNISRADGKVTVTVTQGSVLFTPNAGDSNGSARTGNSSVAPQPLRLDKGQSVTYDDVEKRVEARHDSGPSAFR